MNSSQLLKKIDSIISAVEKVNYVQASSIKRDDEKEKGKGLDSISNNDKINFRSEKFLIDNMSRSMDFFNPDRCIDKSGGGFYHFYGDDGTVYDKTTKVLATEARFIFTYATAYKYIPNKKYITAIEHSIKFLRGPLRNKKNGGYHWIIENGAPTESIIRTYAISFVLLAYSKAYSIGVKECKEYIKETYDLMEKNLFEAKYGLYAEETDENWVKTDYRSQSGNLHACEALIAAYSATNEIIYLDRALLIADNICNRQGGLCNGLVWEHYKKDWSIDMSFNNDSDELTIFRPWGFQTGHQTEWSRFLLMLNEYCIKENKKIIWLEAKAKYLFDISIKHAWDNEYGGLAYNFNPNGEICDYDKIFWTNCESIGSAAMLAMVTKEDKYWDIYDKLWKYCWKYFVDHKHGSWYRRCNRKFEKYFKEKTLRAKCIDPDYHILGGFDGALMMWNKYNK